VTFKLMAMGQLFGILQGYFIDRMISTQIQMN
jgi:hypothetical protein